MKSVDEIKKFMNEVEEEDFLGAMRSDFIDCLPYDDAKEYLLDSVTADEWEKDCMKSDADIIKRIKEYLPFAWGKAYDERGISASRSIQHFRAWFFLLGEDEFYKKITWMEDNEFAMYGKPILETIENWLREHGHLEVDVKEE